jgi:hypothetical protein
MTEPMLFTEQLFQMLCETILIHVHQVTEEEIYCVFVQDNGIADRKEILLIH